MAHMIGWVALGIALVLNAVANTLLKTGSSVIRDVSRTSFVAALSNPYLIGGVVLFALNVVCYAFALSRLPLTLAYPVMVIGGLCIVTMAATLMFGEVLSYVQIAGLACVAVGVVLLYI